MSMSDYYMNLPYDLAGSRAKNRFRNEILWGLKKILELYKEDIEFTMVFDYSCDIEVHKTDSFEFYQVKTQNDNGTYMVDKLIKRNKSGDSVFGKLYKLKYDPQNNENNDITIGLVSNAPLNDGKKTYNNIQKVNLASIDPEAVEKIKKNMKIELELSEGINLKNSSFEKTGMDLIYPEKTLIGEIVLFFEDTFNSEPKKVGFKLLKGEIERKASYELKLPVYEDILEKKGVSKAFLDRFMSNYIEKTDVAVEKAKMFIEEIYKDSFRKKCTMLRSLSQVMGQLSSNNKQLKKIETEIIDWLIEKLYDLPENEIEIIEVISKEMNNHKPIEMSGEDIQALIILVMKKYEEGVYGI
ncbi:DUF4297 domain-containing protein [Bacillus sp. ISL-75]|nr:DUF4297 domain-containing protein [Bacillus sp. ISL-75]